LLKGVMSAVNDPRKLVFAIIAGSSSDPKVPDCGAKTLQPHPAAGTIEVVLACAASPQRSLLSIPGRRRG
jgi:hypothetical protein